MVCRQCAPSRTVEPLVVLRQYAADVTRRPSRMQPALWVPGNILTKLIQNPICILQLEIVMI